MKADESDQWYVLAELEGHTVTGWDEQWVYVNTHFTHAAAEAFINQLSPVEFEKRYAMSLQGV